MDLNLPPLQASYLYSFLDEDNGYNIHFLEAQTLMADLVARQELGAGSLDFFREAVLSFLPMVTFLKAKESLGLYIDSENPYFRFKLEANQEGFFRTLLSPENMGELPKKVTGICR